MHTLNCYQVSRIGGFMLRDVVSVLPLKTLDLADHLRNTPYVIACTISK